MNRPPVLLIVLVFASSVVFLFNYYFTDSYLRHADGVAFELRSSKDSLYQWKIADQAPFKYRLLFPKIVKATWQVLRGNENDNKTFIRVYRAWVFGLYLSSVLSFFFLLRVMSFSLRQAFAGSLIYLLLPAMSFAFTFPVHTREDLLCYTLLNLGLIAFIQDRKILFLGLSIAGVFCRETLLILPFIYLFYGKDKIVTRVVISVIPGVAWLVMRWMMGNEQYDALGLGLKDNLENIFQTCAFLVMSFGVLWIPFLMALISKKEEPVTGIAVIFASAWPAFILVLLSTVFLGRVMEIRLLYLLAPWVIPVALYGIDRRQKEIIVYFRSGVFFIAALSASLLIAATYGLVWIYRPHLYTMMRSYWWEVLFVSTLMCIISLPMLRSWNKKIS